MAYIKRTVMRLHKKRIAKAELALLIAGCPVRPSSHGVKSIDTKLLFTTDDYFISSSGVPNEPSVLELTKVINGSVYNR